MFAVIHHKKMKKEGGVVNKQTNKKVITNETVTFSSMLCQCGKKTPRKTKHTTEQYYVDAFTTTQQGGRLGNTMQHDIRAKEDRSLFFSAPQHRAQLAPAGLLETSTVMLPQKHTMPPGYLLG